jgi:hypothetical protein
LNVTLAAKDASDHSNSEIDEENEHIEEINENDVQ